MSICSDTQDALPGILSQAAQEVPKAALRGASYITREGVVLYEVVIDGRDLVLTFGHLPFAEMVKALCAFLNAEGPEDKDGFDPDELDHQHAIVKSLTYRRVSLPEDFTSFDMTQLNWFGGHTPVTVWVR
jgi:hypothetical protein